MRTKRLATMVALATLTIQSVGPAAAQMTTLPYPNPDRPTPLPQPVPGGPQIQPPRPYPGGPQIQPPRPGYGNNQGYAGTIRCEASGSKTRRCNVRTQNRVVLLSRQGGTCTQGRTWGYDARAIWVSNKCRGTFAYGYGNNWSQPEPVKDKDKGPSTALIIGGVAVAAGLVALLASKNGKKSDAPAEAATPTPEAPKTYPPGPPASLSADLGTVPAEARPSMQTCLFEASRQIGATGGTRLRFDKVTSLEPGNGGWRFHADTTATYPDGDRAIPIYCRATPSKVVQLDFTT